MCLFTKKIEFFNNEVFLKGNSKLKTSILVMMESLAQNSI